MTQDPPNSKLWLIAVEALQLNCLLQASPVSGSWSMVWLLLGVLLATLVLPSLGLATLLSLLVVVSRGIGGFGSPAFSSSELPGGLAHHLLKVFPFFVVQWPTSKWGKLAPK